MKLDWKKEVEQIDLGDIVIYHLSDGLGGIHERAAIVVATYPNSPKTADLMTFPPSRDSSQLFLKGINPTDETGMSNHYSPTLDQLRIRTAIGHS